MTLQDLRAMRRWIMVSLPYEQPHSIYIRGTQIRFSPMEQSTWYSWQWCMDRVEDQIVPSFCYAETAEETLPIVFFDITLRPEFDYTGEGEQIIKEVLQRLESLEVPCFWAQSPHRVHGIMRIEKRQTPVWKNIRRATIELVEPAKIVENYKGFEKLVTRSVAKLDIRPGWGQYHIALTGSEYWDGAAEQTFPIYNTKELMNIPGDKSLVKHRIFKTEIH